MKIITLNHNNINKEHICCALSNQNDKQVISKKDWLKQEFENGLVFKKMNLRGKCFIEYIPIENAWINIHGKDYMYINCMWVSGKFQKKGNGQQLLDACIQDSISKGKKGIIILSTKKKMPFLMDYQFLKKFGFYEVDQWNDCLLMYFPLKNDEKHPSFKINSIKDQDLILYYSYQCPFNIKYVELLNIYCQEHHIPLKCIHLKTKDEAKNAPTPYTTYSLFYHQQFITREVLTVEKFKKIWDKIKE